MDVPSLTPGHRALMAPMRYEGIGERRPLQAWIRPASARRVVASADCGDATVPQWLKPITERGQPAGDGRTHSRRSARVGGLEFAGCSTSR